MLRIAINGYGRIGRCVLRAWRQSAAWEHVDIVAINDLSDFALLAHLSRFDSTHGPFTAAVSLQGNELLVDGRRIRLSAERDMQQLPWRALDVDVVLECSGMHTRRQDCLAHLQAGARKVLISAPAEGADLTVVYGVNQHQLQAAHQIVSNASCTTNCLAPLLQVLHSEFGVVQGLMTTVHAFTNDQVLIDKVHGDPYRSRAATQSIIPTRTGAAKAVGEVLPELHGRLDGMALRVPVQDVSVVDLHLVCERAPSVEAVHACLRAASTRPELQGILAYNELPLVSVDFAHHSASCIFDATQTRVAGHLLKVMAWYDNEWGFAHRMLDVARCLHAVGY